MSNDKKTAEEILRIVARIPAEHSDSAIRSAYIFSARNTIKAMQQFSDQETASLTARYEMMVKENEKKDKVIAWLKSEVRKWCEALKKTENEFYGFDELALNEFNKKEGNK
jgi:hypothetical protein